MKFARLILLPWLILATALGVTWLVWDHERQTTRKELRSQFDFSLREAVSRIEQRMSAYEQVLRGVQSLFGTAGLEDQRAFSGYVESLQLDANFSGIQAFGVVEQVPGARLEAHVAAMREMGYRDYAITPDGTREYYAPIVQHESYVGRNRIGPGFDTWAEPVRRLAMERARDSGMTAISGKVGVIVDAKGTATPGFVMYLPIYARGQPRDSLANRRIHLLGWVFASFRMDDVIASLYGEQPPGLAFEIHDDVEQTASALLYRSSAVGSRRQVPGIVASEYLVVAGHTWTLSARALDDFETRFARDATNMIAGAGIGLSLLLAMLARLLVTGRTRALRLAAEMTSELRQSEEKFERLFELSPDAVIVATRTGVIRTVNRKAEWLLGYSREELVGQVIEKLIPERFRADYVAQREEYSRESQLRAASEGHDLFVQRKDGSECQVEINLGPITTPEGIMIISTIHDITERKRLESEVRQLAFLDPLTQLPNRRLLYDRLGQTMAASKRDGCYGALMFLDLDNFKLLNDTHGHVVGDLLLIETADRLKKCVRESDTVARFGGDEFVVVLGDLVENKDGAIAQALSVAEKIRLALAETYLLTVKREERPDETIEHRCTVSIGVALFTNHEASQDDILKWADAAMYQTKDAGRNSIRFHDTGF